ncbi:hypothetical protein ACJX0J_015002, partial [Zea mays]
MGIMAPLDNYQRTYEQGALISNSKRGGCPAVRFCANLIDPNYSSFFFLTFISS